MEFHIVDRDAFVACDALLFGLLLHQQLVVHA